MQLENFIRNVPDFPKTGIMFKDITTLLAYPEAFSESVDMISELVKNADKII